MTLRARHLERAIRRAVKTALRASGALWGDFRQVRKRQRQNLKLPGWAGRIFFLIWASFMLTIPRRPVELIAAVIVLWTLGMLFLRAAQFRTALFFSPALGVYKYLPLADADVFVLQWQAFLRLAFWSALDFTVAYSIVASKLVHASNFVLTGLILGVAQSLCITTSAICLYAFVRPILFRIAPLFLVSAVALAAFGSNQAGLIKGVIHFAYWLPPVGWIFHLLGLVTSPTWFFDLLPAVMAGSLLALFPIAWKRARDFYVPTEDLFVAAERAASANPVPTLQGVAEHVRQDPGEVRAGIESRAFLQPLDWENLGLIERWVARLLNPRERLIAEFMLAGRPQWTKGLRAFVIFLALALGVLLLIGRLAAIGPWILAASFFLRFFNAHATWRGFGLPRGSGPQSPFYALYPFGFRELMITVLKINLARFFLLLPILLLCGVFFVKSLGLETGPSIITGLKLIWLAIVLQPVGALLMVSSQSSDSYRPSFVFAALFFILATLASGVFFFMGTNVWLLLASAIALALLPLSGLLLYGRSFNRVRFDLIPVRTEVFPRT